MEALEQLPARMSAVESQIVQLREEMHGGFSVLRGEMGTLNERVQHVEALNERTNRRMEELHAQALEHADRLHEQTIGVVEMLHAGTNRRIDEESAETRRHTRVLFEELIGRIELIGEGRATKKRRGT